MNRDLKGKIAGPLAAIVLSAGVAAGWALSVDRAKARSRCLPIQMRGLERDGYEVMEGVDIPCGSGGHAHFDFVIVSLAGLFVIDLIDFGGTIIGSDESLSWTSCSAGSFARFPNPVQRTACDADALRSLLSDYPRVPIVPIIAFASGSTLDVRSTTHIIERGNLAGVVRGYRRMRVARADAGSIALLIASSMQLPCVAR